MKVSPADAGLAPGRFVWVADEWPRRNQFVRFTRRLDFRPGAEEEAVLHLFADTRYRLRVNGQTVARGPARFVTQFPEYDTVDLRPHLRLGENLLEVEVNFFGASSFQSMPDGEPGFWAAGRAGEVDLATPGEWQAERLVAWRHDAPLFSFAQNPVEICDTRLLADGRAAPLQILSGASCPWGDLRPYSGSPLSGAEICPQHLTLTGLLRDEEVRFGFMTHDGGATDRMVRGEKTQPWAAFQTWVFSPRAQSVRMSCFWSELTCNGEPVAVDPDTPYGNHGYSSLDLRSGWNHVVGEFCVLAEYWAYLLGLPKAAGVTLHALPDAHCAQVFAVSPVSPRHEIQLPQPGSPVPPAGWRLLEGNALDVTPARLMAWDEVEEHALRQVPRTEWPRLARWQGAAATWCFSFAGEYLGYPVLEVEAPAGSILDLAYDDWAAPSGGVALYRSNPFTDAADRFVLSGGRQKVEVFHPRGGKLLQVTLRPANGLGPVALHHLTIISRQRATPDHTVFSCDQETLTWLWPVALRTLTSSTDEAYGDCPWRERGTYVGDALVNLHLDSLLTGDARTARRCLQQFAQAVLPDGQIPCCAPAWLRKAHEDYTLLWMVAVRDYWAWTGDLSLAREVWPVVQGIWHSPAWRSNETGLWSLPGRTLFIDWGVLPEEREGTANAALNLFRLGALQSSHELASALEQTADAQAFAAACEQLQQNLLAHLWDESEGRLRPSREGSTPALHANTLALAFRFASPAHRQRILNYLEPHLRSNLEQGLRGGQFSGHLELYFLHFLLPALAEHGRPDLAELLIEDHYGYLQRMGDDTLPECFCRVEEAVGSRCHSWSGAGAIYAARYVLGLRPETPGHPNRFLCAPITHHITRAHGRVAHPSGWIEVEWDPSVGHGLPQVQAPPGVTILPHAPQFCSPAPSLSLSGSLA